MMKIVGSALGIVALLLLTTPLRAEESAQQRFEKARSAADTPAKALEAQGYKVKRVGPKRPISTLSIPTGVQCTSTCTFIPPLCSLHCHLI